MNIVIFASDAGSNAQSIINYSKNNNTTKIVLIVTNNPKAGVIGIAKQENIPILMWDSISVEILKDLKIDLIILAGFLKKITTDFISNFRIINIHPSLLPKYGGKGMFGMNVHEAVIKQKDCISGITIHEVNQNYDEGRIIAQFTCKIEENDTSLTLSNKIHKLEHYWYPRVIESLIKNPY